MKQMVMLLELDRNLFVIFFVFYRISSKIRYGITSKRSIKSERGTLIFKLFE